MSLATPSPRTSADLVPVRVALRIKGEPLAEDHASFLTVHSEENAVSFVRRDGQRKTQTFDHVLSPACMQSDVFAAVGAAAVHDVMSGTSATLMAYGQTGAGKSFTMMGDARAEAGGLIPRAVAALFATAAADRVHTYTVTVTVLEVYGDTIVDLLAPGERVVTVSEVKSKGLCEIEALDAEQALAAVRRGFERRATSSTAMNDRSSRSHAICTITVTKKLAKEGARDDQSVRSALTFVDLAGSERLSKTQATGQQRREGGDINVSLLALTRAMKAVADAATFVNYRDCVLTRLLQDALGGSVKAVFIACVSNDPRQYAETKSTLEHAAHAKRIKNAVVRPAELVESEAVAPILTAPAYCERCARRESPSESPADANALTVSRQSTVYAYDQLARANQRYDEELAKCCQLQRELHAVQERHMAAFVEWSKLEQDAVEQLDTLENELKFEREAHTVAKEQAGMLSQDLVVKDSRVQDLERQLAVLLDERLAAKDVEIGDLQNKLKRDRDTHEAQLLGQRTQLDQLKQQLDEQREALATETTSRESLKLVLAEERAKFQQLQEELLKTKHEREAHEEEVMSQQVQLQQLTQELTQAREALQAETSSRAAFELQLAQNQTKLLQLKHELTATCDVHSVDISKKQVELEQLKEKLNNEREKRDAKTAHLDALVDELATKASEIVDLQHELTVEREQLRVEREARAADVGELSERLASRDMEAQEELKRLFQVQRALDDFLLAEGDLESLDEDGDNFKSAMERFDVLEHIVLRLAQPFLVRGEGEEGEGHLSYLGGRSLAALKRLLAKAKTTTDATEITV